MGMETKRTPIDELRQALRINRLRLDQEVERQPELYAEVAEAAVMARSEQDQVKNQLEQAEAEIDLEVRQEAADAGDKVTEKSLQAKVQADGRLSKLRDALLKKKYQAESLEQLREAYRQRGYMLRELSALYIAGYFQSATTRKAGSDLKERRADDVAAKLTEKRRARAQE